MKLIILDGTDRATVETNVNDLLKRLEKANAKVIKTDFSAGGDPHRLSIAVWYED